MNKYTVSHSGAVKSNETGEVHHFQMGEVTELPEDAAAALGESATLVEREKKAFKAPPRNKMVGNSAKDVKTKDEEEEKEAPVGEGDQENKENV